jgi:hypothetical protein
MEARSAVIIGQAAAIEARFTADEYRQAVRKSTLFPRKPKEAIRNTGGSWFSGSFHVPLSRNMASGNAITVATEKRRKASVKGRNSAEPSLPEINVPAQKKAAMVINRDALRSSVIRVRNK